MSKNYNNSRDTAFPTRLHVQTNLPPRMLTRAFDWWRFRSFAIHRVPCRSSDQTAWMQRLIFVFAMQSCWKLLFPDLNGITGISRITPHCAHRTCTDPNNWTIPSESFPSGHMTFIWRYIDINVTLFKRHVMCPLGKLTLIWVCTHYRF